MADAEVLIEGRHERVKIFSMKVTPSMKNAVYSVHVIFTCSGVYVQKLSKCDCPNGWLFCSHTLAIFVLFYAIQLTEEQWSFKDLKAFMPVPIKSLQSVPFAASYLFDKLEVSKSGGKRGV